MKMNEKQDALLEQLRDARELYEQFEADLAQRIADEKWEAKADIRRLVREARSEEVPYRQIGLAIGTSDHATLVAMEQNKRGKK